MSVEIKRLSAWDNNYAQDIDLIFKRMGALSEFFNTNTPYASASAISIASGVSATSRFSWASEEMEVPSDYTVLFDVEELEPDLDVVSATSFAIAVHIPSDVVSSDQYLYFAFNFNDTGPTFGAMSDSGGIAPVKSITNRGFNYGSYAAGPSSPGNRYTVSVRQIYLNGNPQKMWHSISVFKGRACLGAYAFPAPREIESSRIRFAAYSKDTSPNYDFNRTTFRNIVVRRAYETIEAAAVDPGEPPIGGLQRALDGLYLKYWVRPTGELKLYRPGTLNPAMITDHDRVEGRLDNFDNRALRSHVRMAGAYTEAEYVDEELARKIGYRFELANNPFLLTSTVCRVEAKRFINRLKSEAETIQFTMPMNPLLEYEDRITIIDENDVETDWIITSIQYGYAPGVITQTITGRKYVPND